MRSRVWVVWEDDYEGGWIVGIYRTKRAAAKVAKAQPWYEVHSYILGRNVRAPETTVTTTTPLDSPFGQALTRELLEQVRPYNIVRPFLRNDP